MVDIAARSLAVKADSATRDRVLETLAQPQTKKLLVQSESAEMTALEMTPRTTGFTFLFSCSSTGSLSQIATQPI